MGVRSTGSSPAVRGVGAAPVGAGRDAAGTKKRATHRLDGTEPSSIGDRGERRPAAPEQLLGGCDANPFDVARWRYSCVLAEQTVEVTDADVCPQRHGLERVVSGRIVDHPLED
jgi:hypothetical protein